MSDADTIPQDVSQHHSPEILDRPAIGIVTTSESIDNSLAGAAVRAAEHGYHVLVTAESPTQAIVESVGHLPLTFVDPDERPDGVEPIDHLIRYAREIGFPGLIHHETVAESIDYDRSSAELRESTDYYVPAVPASGRTEGEYIIAGILAYNEEIGIGSVVHNAREFADRVIVIDDGSHDNTAKIARQAGAMVLQHESNKGKGAAIETLLDHVRGSRCDALVLLDGDGQHVPSEIPQVVKPILEGEADLVVGSRYLDGVGNGETPRYRRVGQRVLDLLTLGTSKAQMSDTQSGFRALSPEAVNRISMRTNGYGAESDMIDAAVQNDLTIAEEAINVRYKGIDGHSETPLRHGLEVVTFLLYLIRDRHPLLFFGVPGIFVTFAGALYGLDGILIYQNTGQFYPAKVLGSGFLVIIGVLSMFVGLILNRVSNMISEIGLQRSS